MWAQEHQYALNTNNQWVDARKIPFVRGVTYFCDCPFRHRLKHVKPKARMHYFAHITPALIGTKKRKRDNEHHPAMHCGSGGESMQHRLAKHKLREHVNSLSFVMEKCPSCTREVVMHFYDCSVQLEMRSENGRWRYDCMVYDNEGMRLYALEIAHTHFSGEAKIQDTLRAEGVMIAEFLAEDVLAWDGLVSSPRLHNLLMQRTECFQCACRSARLQEWHEDLDHWTLLENVCLKQLSLEHHARISYAQKKKHEHEHTILLMVNAWKQEIRLWNEADEMIWSYWEIQVRNCAFDKLLATETHTIGKAIHVLHHYQAQILLGMGRPHWDSECLNDLMIRKESNGFLLHTWDTELPVPKMFLLLLDQDSQQVLNHTLLWGQLRKIWHAHKLSPDLVLGLKCSTVMNKLKELQAGNHIVLKSCLFPILKDIEGKHRLCAQCGQQGHIQRECHRQFCTKCGRAGHTWADCFAKTDLNGNHI
jgi:hypothetical protein